MLFYYAGGFGFVCDWCGSGGFAEAMVDVVMVDSSVTSADFDWPAWVTVIGCACG